jgi:Sortilin, neurotensin receptor 3,
VVKCTLDSDQIGDCRVLLPHVQSMFYYHSVLFVSLPLSEKVREPLYFSTDEGATMLPVLLPEDYAGRYTVLSSADEDSIWINVASTSPQSSQQAGWGDTFASALDDEVFSLVLRHTKRAPRFSSVVDVRPLYSLPGAYVANQVTDVDATHPQGSADRVRSLLSYDNGGEWNPLPVPASEEDSCVQGAPCSLHLFGPAESSLGYPYSKRSAIGIVMATGNVGEFLEVDPRGDEVDTYLTRDGGHTWIKIAEGARTYEIADHGGLLVLVDISEPTSEFLYSWDEGATWTSCHFTGQGDMDVRNVIALPSGKSQTFLLYGTRRIGKSVHQVLVQLDFTTLHERPCVGAETPGAPDSTLFVVVCVSVCVCECVRVQGLLHDGVSV